MIKRLAFIIVALAFLTAGASAQSVVGQFTCAANSWMSSIALADQPVCTQPAFSNLSGQATLAQLPNIGANTVLGSIAGGSPSALSATQLTTLCNPFTVSLNGCVTSPGSATGKVLSDNGTWIASAGGGTVTSITGDGGIVTGTGSALTTSGTVYVQQHPPGGRLTLTSATPITTTDVTGATSIFYAPMNSPWVPIYNGTVMRQYLFTSSATDAVGLTVALGSNWATNSNYDWFIGLNSSVVTLCSGPAWTSDTARGAGAGTTELQLYNGMWTNKNSMTCRSGNATTFTCAVNQCTYLGTNRTVAAGQAEDSMAKRFVWNAYNQVQRVLKNVTETTVSWTYTLTAPRQANANAANQLDMVVGLAGSLLDAKVSASGDTSAGGSFVGVGIGINSTTVNSSQEQQTTACLNRCSISAILQTYPAIGRQFYPWLEFAGVASGTNTYEGGSTTYLQSGIFGAMLM